MKYERLHSNLNILFEITLDLFIFIHINSFNCNFARDDNTLQLQHTDTDNTQIDRELRFCLFILF